MFKGPYDADWRSIVELSESEDDKKNAEANRSDLHNSLLASLQMQHLVVLAGSGCSFSAGGPSMDNLWVAAVGEPPSEAAKKAAKIVGYDIEIKNIESLLSRVEASLQLKEDKELADFLNNSKKIILDKCTDFLKGEQLEAHCTFLHRLSRRRVRDQRLKVFTTNYDLCFERAASTLGSVVLDGFSFSMPRRYDPRFFSYDIVRRSRGGDESTNYLEGVFLLYKLHGSVNWARKQPDNSIYEEVRPNPGEACLIYPAFGKYQQSFTQPHLEAMAQYLAALREPNSCILVSGFGFNDAHLAEPLLAAMTSNPHVRLIVVDARIQEHLIGENQYWKRLSDLCLQGEDIWFISADFNQFSQLIPDLKSLTPADALMKAIKGVTKQS